MTAQGSRRLAKQRLTQARIELLSTCPLGCFKPGHQQRVSDLIKAIDAMRAEVSRRKPS